VFLWNVLGGRRRRDECASKMGDEQNRIASG
jgi:hypothetical protein